MSASKRFPLGEDPIDPTGDGLLRGRSPREVMRRLANGDPLEIGPRAEAVLDEQGLLLDSSRVYLRALARVAYAACANGAPRELGPWLRAQIERSAAELLEEDREAEQRAASDECFIPQYTSLCVALGVLPAQVRRFSVAFHKLPLIERRVLRAALHGRDSHDKIARALGRSEHEIESIVRVALESLQRLAGARLDALPAEAGPLGVARASAGETSSAAARPSAEGHGDRDARRELSELLRQLCRTRLIEDPRSIGYFTRYRGLQERVEPIPEEVLQRQLRELDVAFPGVSWTVVEQEIRSSISNVEVAKASVAHLARLGYQVSPGDDWRVMAVMAHVLDGRVGAAEEVARRTLKGSPTSVVKLRCLELLAVCGVGRGDIDQAFRYSKRACALRPEYPLGEMNLIIMALLSGRESEALCASTRLHDLVGSSHEMVDAMVQGNLARRQSGPWYSSPLARDLVRRLSGRLKPAAQQIASSL